MSFTETLEPTADEETKARYRDRFVTSGRYEYRFCDAAWREAEWAVSV